MKKILAFFIPLLALTVTSCDADVSSSPSLSIESSQENADVSDSSVPTDETNTSSPASEGNRAIVVYFSATGNTERVATTIAETINSPLYELVPVDPYTSADLNYGNSDSRVSQEHLDPNRHVELTTVSFDGFEEAEYVFLGAPVWWQELSWVIDNFVEQNDFTGKTILPFGTSSSSGFSTDNLENLAPEATWVQGQRFSSRASEDTIQEWIDSLNLDL